MFEKFSERSRQVVFAARFKAGERGANAIDTNDLLVSLILEDQGLLLTKQFLSSVFGEEGELVGEVPIHAKFFPVDVAQDLLANLSTNQNKSEPVPTFVEIPLSTALEHVFKSANVLAVILQHSQIEPLHLSRPSWKTIPVKERNCCKVLASPRKTCCRRSTTKTEDAIEAYTDFSGFAFLRS